MSENKYSKLDKSIDYDEEAVEQLAAALNEVTELERKVADLKELINENKELHQFVWRTAENEVLALHKIEDDHLNNILAHQVRVGRPISKAIRSEARKRGLLVPVASLDYGRDPYYLDEGAEF